MDFRAPLLFNRRKWQMAGNSSLGSRLMSGQGSVNIRGVYNETLNTFLVG